MITLENYIDDLEYIVSADLPWGKLRDVSVLITGGTGLIGSCLTDALILADRKYRLGLKLILMVRSKERAMQRFAGNDEIITYLVQDICTPLPDDVNADYIVNCASNAHPKLYAAEPVGTILTNVLGMNNLLEYSARHGVKRVLELSSVEIYGENRGDTERFDESYCGALNCSTYRSGYPESKRVCEALCHSYAAQYGIDCVIARLSRCYGPTMNMSDSKASAQFIKNALAGEDIVLKSSGKQRYSYLYMADAVSGILTVLLKGQSGEAYNVADELSDITLGGFAQAAAQAGGTKVIYDIPESMEGYSGAIMSLMCGDKLKALGWKALNSISDGVNKTVSILRKEKL